MTVAEWKELQIRKPWSPHLLIENFWARVFYVSIHNAPPLMGWAWFLFTSAQRGWNYYIAPPRLRFTGERVTKWLMSRRSRKLRRVETLKMKKYREETAYEESDATPPTE